MARSNVLRGDRIAVNLTTKGYLTLSSTAWDNNQSAQLTRLLSGYFDYVAVNGGDGSSLWFVRCQNSCQISVEVTARQNYDDAQRIAEIVNASASQLAAIDQSNISWRFVQQVQNETPITQVNTRPADTALPDNSGELDKTLLYVGAFALLLFLLKR